MKEKYVLFNAIMNEEIAPDRGLALAVADLAAAMHRLADIHEEMERGVDGIRLSVSDIARGQ